MTTVATTRFSVACVRAARSRVDASSRVDHVPWCLTVQSLIEVGQPFVTHRAVWHRRTGIARTSAGSGRPANGDHAPDGLDDAEGPGAAREAVGTRERAPEGEEDDEATAPRLRARTSPS